MFPTSGALLQVLKCNRREQFADGSFLRIYLRCMLIMEGISFSIKVRASDGSWTWVWSSPWCSAGVQGGRQLKALQSTTPSDRCCCICAEQSTKDCYISLSHCCQPTTTNSVLWLDIFARLALGSFKSDWPNLPKCELMFNLAHVSHASVISSWSLRHRSMW